MHLKLIQKEQFKKNKKQNKNKKNKTKKTGDLIGNKLPGRVA